MALFSETVNVEDKQLDEISSKSMNSSGMIMRTCYELLDGDATVFYRYDFDFLNHFKKGFDLKSFAEQ